MHFVRRMISILIKPIIPNVMTEAQAQALVTWQRLRRRTYRSWFLNILLAILGSYWFVSSYQRADPTFLVILLIIPVLSLRGAWRDDRIIRNCNAQIAQFTRYDISGQLHQHP